MYTLGTHFEELLVNIRPPVDRVVAARELPPKVRDFLREHEEFITCAPHSRLAGSYAQDMSVGDIKDVDFLVRIPGDPRTCTPSPRRIISNLADVLDSLPEALGFDGCAGVDVERARRSVHVYICGKEFHLDVVPCIAPDGFEKPIWVPDRGWNKWVRSHPIGFVLLLDKLNGKYGGKVKPLGKLLKHFRNVQMNSRKPKSYWLGALLVNEILCDHGLDMRKSLAELFHGLLAAIHTRYDHLRWTSNTATPNLKDPMLGHNVSWNWSRSHFETFMRRVKEGRDLAYKALEANDRETAIGLWQRVFGEDYFPDNVTKAAGSQAQSGWPGSAYVTTTGLVTAARVAAVSTPSMPTRFHGDPQP